MQTDGPDPSRDGDATRLTWAPPKPEVAPWLGAEPVVTGPAPKHAAKPRKATRPVVDANLALVPAPSPAPAPAPATVRPVVSAAAPDAAAPDAAPTPAPVPPEPEPHLGRAFADAFDRLADRLLERLRSLRQDVDADLAGVRAELAGLRQAVDAVGDRVQVRHIRTTLDEVNGEVIALRRAVLEWPELEQVSLDLTAIRGDLSFLFETSGAGQPGQAPERAPGRAPAPRGQPGRRGAAPGRDDGGGRR